MKNLSFKIEDDLHCRLKLGATMEGRAIVEILKDLINKWVQDKDPFIHQLKSMPITQEEVSPETMSEIEAAMKEKPEGSYEDLSKELHSRKKK